MRLVINGLAAVLILFVSSPSFSQATGDQVSQDGVTIELTSDELLLVNQAAALFKRKVQNFSCFRVNLSKRGIVVRLDFIPSNNVVTKEDNLIVNASKCKGGLSYLINGRDKSIKTIHSR